MEEKNLLILCSIAIVAIVAIVVIGFSMNNRNLIGQAAGGKKDSVGGHKVWPKGINGQHYGLNIIGADKHADVGDSMGHTLFVQLQGKTKIMMTQDPEGQFKVVDRNGLDGSAEFNIAPGHYNVYARALGKPGGKSSVDAYGEFYDAQDGETVLWLGYVDISRPKGRSSSVNINNLFYVDVTLCIETDLDGNCIKWVEYTDYWVFDIDELLEYWWEYNNQGLKLMQVRFYGCTLDETGTATDYCRWGDGSPIASKKVIIS